MLKDVSELELGDFKHGDLIQVVSHERNCGIDQTVFTALVVNTKEGLIAIPQDFQSHLLRSSLGGVGWEMEIEWLLGNDVEINIISQTNEIKDEKYDYSEEIFGNPDIDSSINSLLIKEIEGLATNPMLTDRERYTLKTAIFFLGSFGQVLENILPIVREIKEIVNDKATDIIERKYPFDS